MSDQSRIYLAATGLITPVGANTAMTAAAARAEVSAYRLSHFYGQNDIPITMALVPDGVFSDINADIIEGNRFNERQDRVIKMAILAIREACAKRPVLQPIPLLLASPEGEGEEVKGFSPFLENLQKNCQPWVNAGQCRQFHFGRAAGLEAIAFAFRYLHDLPDDYLLVGGSDSYQSYSRLHPLSQADRLLSRDNKDGFAPGEAACFLLLTRHPQLAHKRNGHMIALYPPGLADEPGHLGSPEPYRGEGLDQAFKKALVDKSPATIHSIYSSMNGEHYWAKEYGVAFTRNSDYFHDPVKIEHLADCFGDLGSATAPALIALAAEDLWKHPKPQAHLVYSSSDGPKRGAIVVEKRPVTA